MHSAEKCCVCVCVCGSVGWLAGALARSLAWQQGPLRLCTAAQEPTSTSMMWSSSARSILKGWLGATGWLL